MVSGTMFHERKNSWPPEEYIQKATLQLLDFDSAAPPVQAWRRKLNSHACILKEFSVTFGEAVKMVGLGLRLWSYVREEASHGRKAPIDPFTRISCKPSASQGVPLGGMGSGSITRGFRGEFRNFQIVPGTCDASPIMANQFSVFISRDGGAKQYASVLSPGKHDGLGKPSDQGISSWGWNLSGQHSTYHALFPRAWTVYDGEPDPELKICCRQISPFIPHNYRDSSLPTTVFVYTVVNTGKERGQPSLHVGGGVSHLSGDHVNEPFIGEDGVSGVLLHHKTAKGHHPVTYAIAACETQNVTVTVLPSFGLSEGSSPTAKDMWDKMVQKGQFESDNFNAGPSMPSSPGETNCAAISASATIEPHGKCTIAFALAWSSPIVKFSKGKSYSRRYTKYYGNSERAASNLVHDALRNYKRWEEEIENWQSPVLADETLPEWYKFTLFNELYFLVSGGTVWIDSEVPAANVMDSTVIEVDVKIRQDGGLEKTNLSGYDSTAGTGSADDGEGTHLGCSDEDDSASSQEGDRDHFECPSRFSDPVNDADVGRFLYLEGIEYVMWCTYDVHFYASFALLELFPKIELSIQREFAKAVLCEDGRKVKFLAEGNWGIRKVRGAVPHDLGTHDPWLEMNAYNIHDTSKWKDLNPKFVLQVYRDFAATGDLTFGADVWPAVCAAMEYMEQFDRDGDCLIENDGFPDQTYDTWTVHGVSAYCGCLWVAALQATVAMASQLGYRSVAERYKSKFVKAKSIFEAKLWNGLYFNYDSGSSSNSKSIQADQLAGQWYMASSGLPNLFDDLKIRSSLQKIYDFNVMKVRGGKMGAVNGMHPDGKVDETCMQSREVWAGVTYGLAATMIHAGMKEQAFTTAEGIFLAGWSDDGFGYAFQTPEAWTMDGHFRSLVYMRPLAIWGMQRALCSSKVNINAPQMGITDRINISPRNSRSHHTETNVRKLEQITMSSQSGMGDSNDPTQSQPQATQTQASSAKRRRQMKGRSEVWDHFNKFTDAEGNLKARCKYCDMVYFSDPSVNGTSALSKHLKVCKKLPLSGESKQTQLSLQTVGENESILKKWHFDQKASRHKLAAMVIIDELPFRFVEGEGFKDFMHTTQPLFKVPSRFTVARDCYQIFLDEKKKLITYFKMSGQRVCITTDTWTSIQKINYMCITAHYIDHDWKLHKKIINFCPIEGHKGELLARDLDMYLKEWEISKVFAITVDNASSNYTCVELLKDRLTSRGADFLNGKYMHMRCIAHIINLIVNDGLHNMKVSIKRVRKAVRFINQSPARLAKFKECIDLQNIACKSMLCLDVSTRWNSTYLMLNVAQKLQKAFEIFERMDPYFVVELNEQGGVPTSWDWGNVRRLVDMFVHFYELTLRISGSLYVTSNIFYHEISTVSLLLKEWMRSDDVDVRFMGETMKEKYDKYWGDVNKMNKLIYVAVVVDPRYKLEFLEFALVEEYGNEIGWKLANDTRVVVKELFEEYKKSCQPKNTQTQVNQGQSSNKSSTSRTQSTLGERFIRQKLESGEVESKCELDIYLKESVYFTKNDEFDILKWWKVNSSRFPILSQLARDVLAIPISTVASESAFSAGGRFLDPYRSSLSPKVVEGLLCAQDWLRSYKRPKTIEEDLDDLEKFGEVFSALNLNKDGENDTAINLEMDD